MPIPWATAAALVLRSAASEPARSISVRVADDASFRETSPPSPPLPSSLRAELPVATSASAAAAGALPLGDGALPKLISRAPSTRSLTLKCERDEASCR